MKKITPQQYARGLYAALEGKKTAEADKIFDNFLRLVWLRKDWKNLNKIVLSFKKYYYSQQGMVEAEATFAHQPGAAEKEKFLSRLEKITGKNPLLKIALNKDLIGGAVVEFNDTVLDLSVARQLKNLQQTLTK